jgi:hypothetical protein
LDIKKKYIYFTPLPKTPKMKTISPKFKIKQVKDYISVIENASELFELYNANLELEILKINLVKKKRGNNDLKIIADINLASQLQDMCKRRV